MTDYKDPYVTNMDQKQQIKMTTEGLIMIILPIVLILFCPVSEGAVWAITFKYPIYTSSRNGQFHPCVISL